MITEHAPQGSPRWGLALKHVARNGDRSTTVKVIRSTDELGAGGTAASRIGVHNPTAVMIFLPRDVIQTKMGTNHLIGVNLRARSPMVNWTGVLILFGLLYHRSHHQTTWQSKFRSRLKTHFLWYQAQTSIAKLFYYKGSTTLLYRPGANSLKIMICRASKMT
jgi:hypothetical protein